ncbi:hypothetical protein D9M73_275100 [compost metagenome]
MQMKKVPTGFSAVSLPPDFNRPVQLTIRSACGNNVWPSLHISSVTCGDSAV